MNGSPTKMMRVHAEQLGTNSHGSNAPGPGVKRSFVIHRAMPSPYKVTPFPEILSSVSTTHDLPMFFRGSRFHKNPVWLDVMDERSGRGKRAEHTEAQRGRLVQCDVEAIPARLRQASRRGGRRGRKLFSLKILLEHTRNYSTLSFPPLFIRRKAGVPVLRQSRCTAKLPPLQRFLPPDLHNIERVLFRGRQRDFRCPPTSQLAAHDRGKSQKPHGRQHIEPMVRHYLPETKSNSKEKSRPNSADVGKAEQQCGDARSSGPQR